MSQDETPERGVGFPYIQTTVLQTGVLIETFFSPIFAMRCTLTKEQVFEMAKILTEKQEQLGMQPIRRIERLKSKNSS